MCVCVFYVNVPLSLCFDGRVCYVLRVALDRGSVFRRRIELMYSKLSPAALQRSFDINLSLRRDVNPELFYLQRVR